MAIEAIMFDVEMEGKSGHTCHVYVLAKFADEAQDVASRQFPELSATDNVMEV